VLHWCRRLIGTRRDLADLREGGQLLLDAPDGVLAWRRGARTTAVANLSAARVRMEEPGTVVLATDPSREGRPLDDELEPWGCVVIADPA
jgi:alpha-glucosidase